jgi:hypothetical protein
MVSVSNPFVDYLSRYTTASPDHEAAFDEFLAQAPEPAAGPLRLATKVEAFLGACFQRPDPPSIILTGNAGDGKTYLCRQIVAAFSGEQTVDWTMLAEQPIERGGVRLHVVKDLSELGNTRGADVLRGLADSLGGATGERYLIAANEGRLRALLGEHAALHGLYQQVDEQLQRGVDSGSPKLVVINLNAVSTSTFVPAALRWMTADEHWSDCTACPIHGRCPVRHNARQLRDEYIAGRVQLLYQLLEHLDIHVTVRDMLIHLAYTLTGDQRCAELQRLDGERRDLSNYAYYENVWGGPADGAFRRKASVVQQLERLRVGDHSQFEIDDFVVNGGDNAARQADHQQLFTPAVDLNFRRFEQDRRAYVEGGADREADEEAAMMLRWLPHCRRKLFFEWHASELVNKLIPFLYLDTYLSLLHSDRAAIEQVRHDLVLGLNRAFARLYLTDADNLYVTTQYLHSAEQPRPLVRMTIPASGIEPQVDRRLEMAYDRERPDLHLRIAPPPVLAFRPGMSGLKPESWRLNLLTFEYLMRLAHGGTYNILADECELSVRAFKDQLISAFAGEPGGTDTIEFFVAERRRYVLKKLQIDEHGNLRSGG